MKSSEERRAANCKLRVTFAWLELHCALQGDDPWSLADSPTCVCKSDCAKESLKAVRSLGWLSDAWLPRRWPHNSALERSIRTYQEVCRSLHLQAGFSCHPPLWPITCDYAAISLSRDKWRTGFGKELEGTRLYLRPTCFLSNQISREFQAQSQCFSWIVRRLEDRVWFLLSRSLHDHRLRIFEERKVEFHASFRSWGLCERNIVFVLCKKGPPTTISGFIPSYTHLQPWLNRVCWGYNYLITRGAPSCVSWRKRPMLKALVMLILFFSFLSWKMFQKFGGIS